MATRRRSLGSCCPSWRRWWGYVGPRTRSCGGTLGEKQKPPTEEKERKEKKLLSGILALQYLVHNSVF